MQSGRLSELEADLNRVREGLCIAGLHIYVERETYVLNVPLSWSRSIEWLTRIQSSRTA